MKAGDLVRVNLRAPVWDLQPWRGTAVTRWRLTEGDLLLVLEQARRPPEAASGASRILSPVSGITGWVMDDYLDALELAEILTDVEVV